MAEENAAPSVCDKTIFGHYYYFLFFFAEILFHDARVRPAQDKWRRVTINERPSTKPIGRRV